MASVTFPLNEPVKIIVPEIYKKKIFNFDDSFKI